MINKYQWFYYRLKTMSVPEIFFRLKQQIQYKLHRKEMGIIAKPVKTSYINHILPIPAAIPIIRLPFVFTVFHQPVDYINISNWHQDFISGKEFPKIYCFNINILNEKYGSAKVVWEYNRLQFLTYIALQYRVTKEVCHLQAFQRIVTSWIDDNPYLVGVNWYSNIEVSLRLITWFLCWEIIDMQLAKENTDFARFVEEKWLPAIYQHCTYAYRFPSRYSSANNHLISEYAGLFIASSLWKFKESEQWNEYAKKGLEKEIIVQHSENGINKEEAAEYIQFITDFFFLAYIVGQNTGNHFSAAYSDKLNQIFTYIANLLDCKGHFPQYGDEDDGRCFILDFSANFNNFQSLLTSGAIIFKDANLKAKSNGFDLKNYLLFGQEGKATFDSISFIPFSETSKFYPEGHFLFRKTAGASEIYMHVDAAPLGYLSIAAHGHADALSFVLHIDGEPVFIDSGTYTYHTEPEWRKYFMGTLAHNTIRINKTNQAFISGPTMWLQHYKTNIKEARRSDTEDLLEASHDGYTQFGATHTRKIVFDKLNNVITIRDTIQKNNEEEILIELPFHFHPDVVLYSVTANIFELVTKSNTKVYIMIDSKLKSVLVCGNTLPDITGWYSSSFLQKQSCTTVLSTYKTTRTITFESTISIKYFL